MARTYHRDSRGRFAKRPGGSGGSSSRSARAAATAVKRTGAGTGARIQNVSTGGTISREEAALRMFGSIGAGKKIAAANRRRGRGR